MGYKMKFQFAHDDIDYEVEGVYTPAFAGRYYERNGDPGDPPSDSELEVNDLKKNGKRLGERPISKLLEDKGFFTALCNAADEKHRDAENDAESDYHDRKTDEMLGGRD